MNQQILEKIQNLGLTQSEAKTYVAILELGKTSISAIAKKTNINRRNVYDILHTLLDKGLIFQTIGEKEGYFAGVDPEKLIELVRSKEIALNSIMPDLEAEYKKEFQKEKAFIYKGIEGFKKYLQDILTVGQDVYCIGAKGGWRYEALGEYGEWFERERIKKKIKTYDLFDDEMRKVVPGKETSYTNWCENKFLAPGFSTNSAIDIFGDHVVTFTGLYLEKFDDDVTLFVLISQDLADSYRTWFQFMWDSLPKIKK